MPTEPTPPESRRWRIACKKNGVWSWWSNATEWDLEQSPEHWLIIDDYQDYLAVSGPPFTLPADAAAEPLKEQLNDVQATRGYDRSDECRLRDKLDQIRKILETAVCTVDPDKGVVVLSQDGPCHPETINGRVVQVYNHDYFSPLGDALIAAWKLTFENVPTPPAAATGETASEQKPKGELSEISPVPTAEQNQTAMYTPDDNAKHGSAPTPPCEVDVAELEWPALDLDELRNRLRSSRYSPDVWQDWGPALVNEIEWLRGQLKCPQ